MREKESIYTYTHTRASSRMRIFIANAMNRHKLCLYTFTHTHTVQNILEELLEHPVRRALGCLEQQEAALIDEEWLIILLSLEKQGEREGEMHTDIHRRRSDSMKQSGHYSSICSHSKSSPRITHQAVESVSRPMMTVLTLRSDHSDFDGLIVVFPSRLVNTAEPIHHLDKYVFSIEKERKVCCARFGTNYLFSSVRETSTHKSMTCERSPHILAMRQERTSKRIYRNCSAIKIGDLFRVIFFSLKAITEAIDEQNRVEQL
jgi:hypothetical protein